MQNKKKKCKIMKKYFSSIFSQDEYLHEPFNTVLLSKKVFMENYFYLLLKNVHVKILQKILPSVAVILTTYTNRHNKDFQVAVCSTYSIKLPVGSK